MRGSVPAQGRPGRPAAGAHRPRRGHEDRRHHADRDRRAAGEHRPHVGAGGEGVQRREGEHAVAGQMDLPPQAAREVLLGERGQLDREHHVEGHDPERDRERLPGRGQGHEEVHGPERREVVGHQRAHVYEHEPDGEAADEAVHAEQPPRADPPLQDPGRVEHPPEHRGQEQPPRHDPGGSGDVPGQVFGHRGSSGFLGVRRVGGRRVGDQAANAATAPAGWTAPAVSVHQPVAP